MDLLSPTVQYWLNHFSIFGWFLSIPVLERIWFIHQQPFFRGGLISDIIYQFHAFIFQFLLSTSHPITIEAILSVSLMTHFFPLNGDGFLQYSLSDQPLWLNLIVLIIVNEVIFYINHYLFHKVPFLWEFHRVHHSSIVLDSISTMRFHVLDRIISFVPQAIWIAYFGVTSEALVLYFFGRGFMDRFVHSNIDSPRWLHKLMISSPHFHRWHHCSDPAIRDKNFSGDFIFMDLIFSTAYDPEPKDRSPPTEFGELGYSNNIVVQQFLPFVFLYQRAKRLFQKYTNQQEA